MVSSDEIFMDCSSYEQIWNVVIRPTMEDYALRFADVTILEDAKETIWKEYIELNRHCKTKYMKEIKGRLDRHKVCACYMYAVIKAGVMRCNLAASDTEERYLALNENLAITVGMSLLRAFIMASIDNNENLSKNDKEIYKSRVADGITFPDCNHGIYRENFVAELYYTNLERNYNILSLANTLFLLEIHTLETEAVHKQIKKEKTIKKHKVKK